MSNTELIPVTSAELQKIELTKAEAIRAVFIPLSERIAEFEKRCSEISAEAEAGITEDVAKKAKRARIDVGRIRIDTENTRKKEKEMSLMVGRAIDGVANIVKMAVIPLENQMEAIEKYFENMERQRIEILQKQRSEEIGQYIDDIPTTLGSMPDDVYDAYYKAKMSQYEDRIASEAKAEAERIENDRLDKLENYRRLKILPYRHFWTCDDYALRTMSEVNFETICNDLVAAKNSYEKEQARIQEENERLRKEAEEKERVRKEEEVARRAKEEKERKEREAAEARKREEYEAEMRKIREEAAKKMAEREKAEREEKEKREAELAKERAERARIEREEREKREAAERELAAKKAEEERLRREEEARIQAELNKGDSEKVKDLIEDLKSLKTKYVFKSSKNVKMYSDVSVLIDKIINHIGGLK